MQSVRRSPPSQAPPPPDPEAAARIEGLYVHVPFCVRKCAYCDFYSVATGRQAPDADTFLRALERELSLLPPAFAPRTVFIGGGTPTELAPRDFARLLALLRRRVRLEQLEEWTCEANPGTLTDDHLAAAADAGVSRISLGVQSFDDTILRWLGRVHTGRDAREAVERVRAAGFANLNLDFIAAVPGAPATRLAADLDTAVALAPEHISCYTLMFEEGTPLDALRRRGAVRPVDEEVELEEFERSRQLLLAAGYRHYEISAYCRGDGALRCRHNLLYWSGGEYLGVGPGAWSHRERWRYGNVRDLRQWQRALLARDETGEGAQRRIAACERLAPERWAREVFIMWLRQIEGVPLAAFRERTGYLPAELYRTESPDPLERLLEGGWLVCDGDRIRLSERGLPLADAIAAELV